MIKKSVLLLLINLTVTVTMVFSQRLSRLEYIQNYQVLAIKEMNRSGIPASIKMAQACLESDDGNSRLANISNNHFGIKCKSDWNGQYVLFDDDEKNECFRKYSTVEESYTDHTNFLLNNSRYAFLFSFSPTDYKSWAKGLKTAGYATDRHYPERLVKIIEEYELYRLDEKISPEELQVYEQKKIGQTFDNQLTINPYGSRKVEIINGLKTVVARDGDTFEIIAQEFGLKTWEIYRFNDYRSGYQPVENEVLYIQNKRYRAQKDQPTYVAGPDDTMHFISQRFGIRLRPLYSRNGMKTGQKPQPGQVINLRERK